MAAAPPQPATVWMEETGIGLLRHQSGVGKAPTISESRFPLLGLQFRILNLETSCLAYILTSKNGKNRGWGSEYLHEFMNQTHFHLRVKASATLSREPAVTLVLTSSGSVWLLNKQTTAIDLTAGELCGFNVGSYQEVASGVGLTNQPTSKTW